MSNKQIKYASIIGSIFLIIIIFVTSFISVNNSTIRLEENINTSKSNISKEEKRRVDLFNNLVDAVKDYSQYEHETLTKITEARSKAESGKVDEAVTMISAISESYPELKSQENYKQAMLEFSVTENRIASYRESYNSDVKNYNQSIRSFPNSLILSMSGYQKTDFNYLEYETKEDEYKNLF